MDMRNLEKCLPNREVQLISPEYYANDHAVSYENDRKASHLTLGSITHHFENNIIYKIYYQIRTIKRHR